MWHFKYITMISLHNIFRFYFFNLQIEKQVQRRKVIFLRTHHDSLMETDFNAVSVWFWGLSLLTVIATLDMKLYFSLYPFGKFPLTGEDFILSINVLGYLSSSPTMNKLSKQPSFSVALSQVTSVILGEDLSFKNNKRISHRSSSSYQGLLLQNLVPRRGWIFSYWNHHC